MQGSLMKRAAALRLGTRLLFTGFLDWRQVASLFRAAAIAVFPSVAEPFGIAVLEAMRGAAAVIVSRTAGVAEVVRNVVKVDHRDTPGIARVITALLGDPPRRRLLGAAASREAARINWDGTAALTEKAYKELLC